MKKLMLLGILATLASCGGKTGPAGTPGADGSPGATSSGLKEYMPTGYTQVCNSQMCMWVNPTRSYGWGVATSWVGSNVFDGPIDINKIIVNFNFNGINTYALVDAAEFDMLHPTFSHSDVFNFVTNSPTLRFEGVMNGTNLYTDINGKWYYSEDTETSKDLESMGSKLETAEVESVKENLFSYGLSVERTEKLAKLMTSFRKISNKRALSASEKDVFTKELLGMKFDQAAKKMVEDYDGLIETAADKNGTSPEAVKELVNSFLTM